MIRTAFLLITLALAGLAIGQGVPCSTFVHGTFEEGTHTRQEVPVDIPDFLTVRLQMKNGVAGTFVLTETGNTGRPSRFCLQGEKGLLEIPFKVDGELQLGRSGAAGVTWAPCPIDDSLRGRWRVEEEFVGAIRGENPIEYTTFETGVEYMVFTEAVHRSFKMDGIPVSLADI